MEIGGIVLHTTYPFPWNALISLYYSTLFYSIARVLLSTLSVLILFARWLWRM